MTRESETKKIVTSEAVPIVRKQLISLKTFKDIPKDYWAHRSIGCLAALGIIGGFPDGTFRPKADVSRAQLVAILVKDVSSVSWASRYIDVAVSQGWVKGYKDNTFKPDAFISREDAFVIVGRFARESLRVINPKIKLNRAEIAQLLCRTQIVKERIENELYK